MNKKLKDERTRLGLEFKQASGLEPKHFFCPILWRDDEVELCEGHIVNRFFPGASRQWVLQRKDVDGFYGRIFEADFNALNYINSTPNAEFLTNPKISSLLRPKVMADDKVIPHYHAPSNIPDGHSLLGIEQPDGTMHHIGLKISREDLFAAEGASWGIRVDKDLRLAALVSVLKSGFLTMFKLCGYNYAYSVAGRFVGYDILGDFYNKAQELTSAQARNEGKAHFRKFERMVRPIIGEFSGGSSVDSRELQFCFAPSGVIWGKILVVSTGSRSNAVLLPVASSIESIQAFIDFMENDDERIIIRSALLAKDAKRWSYNSGFKEAIWPKLNVRFDDD